MQSSDMTKMFVHVHVYTFFTSCQGIFSSDVSIATTCTVVKMTDFLPVPMKFQFLPFASQEVEGTEGGDGESDTDAFVGSEIWSSSVEDKCHFMYNSKINNPSYSISS